MAVTVVLTPVLQKAEKCRFYQEIGGCYKGTIILKNPVPIRNIPFKCIFVRLKKALRRGKKRTRNSIGTIYPFEYSYKTNTNYAVFVNSYRSCLYN